MTRQVTELAATEGLTYDLGNAGWPRSTRSTPTASTHLAAQHGLGQAKCTSGCSRRIWCDAETLDDVEDAGPARHGGRRPRKDEAREVLAGTKYAGEVDADFAEARRIGVNGVPFFVLNGAYGVSGAQPAELFLQALTQAKAEASVS